jgi:hypothetical protein
MAACARIGVRHLFWAIWLSCLLTRPQLRWLRRARSRSARSPRAPDPATAHQLGQRGGVRNALRLSRPLPRYQLFLKTSCVCVTIATSLPSAVVTRVCHTIVRRPRCKGVVSPTIRLPMGAVLMKLVLLSIVAVRPPSVRFASVPSAPNVSAKAMTAPPCGTAGRVQSSSRTIISATILSVTALTISMPRSAANGSGSFVRRVPFRASPGCWPRDPPPRTVCCGARVRFWHDPRPGRKTFRDCFADRPAVSPACCAGDFESYRASHAVGLYRERRERLDPTRITLPNIVQLLNGCV